MGNQERTGDRSQIELHPEEESSVYQCCNSMGSDPDEASHTNGFSKKIIEVKEVRFMARKMYVEVFVYDLLVKRIL